MPTYEYACTKCGQHVEVFQRVSDDPLTTCGVCGGKLRKVFHPAGILFKGSGFYSTDNRAKSSSGADQGSKSGSSEGSGKSGDPQKSGDSGKSADSGKSGDSKSGESGRSGSKDSGSGSGSGSGGAGKKESKPSGAKESA
ncbi:MAG: FmdB family transcriptional regulator [Actinomycetota bacterium]|nr:FmdB family transcriptional regulator [Actinomycetota bacterium]